MSCRHGSKKHMIGIQNEKTLHRQLKHYICPDETKHEKSLDNWIVDILNGDEIIEIQTRSFRSLRKKLENLLPNYQITIVYPLAKIKYISWITQDGEYLDPRKSPKKGHPLMACYELYQIKNLLNHPNLKIKIIMLELHEFRILDGYGKELKKGASRKDQKPLAFLETIELTYQDDYKKIIPFLVGEVFTTKELMTKLNLSKRQVGAAIQVLKAVEAISFTGKNGRSYLYQINQ